MSRRAHAHADDVFVTDLGTDGLGLFAVPGPAEETVRPSWTETWGSLPDEVRKYHRDRWQQQLEPLVLAMATRPQGVTASEVLAEGIDRGILWGERSFLSRYPRIYAFLGAWLARLARDGKIAPKTAKVEGHGIIHLKRKSERALSNDNEGFIYVRTS